MKKNDALKDEALRAGANRGDVERAVDLLSQGANVNGQGDDGQTALHVAAVHGSAQLVITYVQNGGDVTIVDKNGCTPFMAAVGAKNFGNAAFLLDFKSDINFQPTETFIPPIWHALLSDAGEGCTERTAFLLERGADLAVSVLMKDGTRLTAEAFALQCDAMAGRPIFNDLIKAYTDRDLANEVRLAKLGQQQNAERMENLLARARVEGRKLRLGPR